MADYAQGVTYTIADIWSAYEAGARDARSNGGSPDDALIRQSADAYCKLVHPLAGPLCWDCADGKNLDPRYPELDCPTCGRTVADAAPQGATQEGEG